MVTDTTPQERMAPLMEKATERVARTLVLAQPDGDEPGGEKRTG